MAVLRSAACFEHISGDADVDQQSVDGGSCLYVGWRPALAARFKIFATSLKEVLSNGRARPCGRPQ